MPRQPRLDTPGALHHVKVYGQADGDILYCSCQEKSLVPGNGNTVLDFGIKPNWGRTKITCCNYSKQEGF